MKFLTKSSDYAIRALVVLANNKDHLVSARKISKDQDIPYQFLRRILQVLIQNRLVVSREGGGGGFKIKADPRRISIKDVVKIFHGDIRLAECVFRKKMCTSRSKCILRKEIKRIDKIVEKELGGVTLARLLRTHK